MREDKNVSLKRENHVIVHNISGPFHLISTPPLWMTFLFLQSLRNNVALTPSEIPMDEFKNIAAPLEIPMISSETLQKSTVDEFVF